MPIGVDEPVQLFDATAGFAPITNLLAAGDPDVQRFGDRWWMFFGAAHLDTAGSMSGSTSSPQACPPAHR